jgi:hypothetical protein
MSGSCSWIEKLLREMPQANKPDFPEQQKIIFQAAEGEIARAA